MSSIELKGVASELAAAQQFLTQWWLANALDEGAQFPFELALEELFVNVASYSRDSAGEPCDVRIQLQKDVVETGVITLVISDNGPAFNPVDKDVPELKASIMDRAVGGLGIHLTRSVMDTIDYDYRTGVNHTSVSKRVNHENSSGAP